MKEYIEREAFVHRLMAQAVTDDLYGMGMQMGFNIAAQIALDMPRREIPAADVVEVKRGRWKRTAITDTLWCMACNKIPDYQYETNFCPNCGADMREVDNETD